ncbi:MAG: hypothetical protein JST85_23005 [Acidobacteria bacterium]|nr:hypothetical protein [Acidobacteriota bacterium]
MNTNEIINQEIELAVEQLEEVIAPWTPPPVGTVPQHNETVEVDLTVEEAEAVITPGLQLNHNEVVEVDLTVEEAEAVIAPGLPLI